MSAYRTPRLPGTRAVTPGTRRTPSGAGPLARLTGRYSGRRSAAHGTGGFVDHYAALGVGPDATVEDVEAAYRTRAKTAHPDAGGTQEDFVALDDAHRVLTGDNRDLYLLEWLLATARAETSSPPADALAQQRWDTERMRLRTAVVRVLAPHREPADPGLQERARRAAMRPSAYGRLTKREGEADERARAVAGRAAYKRSVREDPFESRFRNRAKKRRP